MHVIRSESPRLQALKTRYDKALDAYDQSIAKSKELRAAKKPDLTKIFTVRSGGSVIACADMPLQHEKELIKLKRLFEDAFEEYGTLSIDFGLLEGPHSLRH